MYIVYLLLNVINELYTRKKPQDQLLLQLSEPRLEVGADKIRRDSPLQVNDLLAEAPSKQ